MQDERVSERSRGDRRQRLDLALVERQLVPTRARARDLILRGEVRVDGVEAKRPAQPVGPENRLDLADTAVGWVSRGALKLVAGLDAFGVDVRDRIALDVGASTGGFTQVLVTRGAARVYAVDNGRDQLAPSLRGDARVISLEQTDARVLTPELIPEPVGMIVADVSFISLLKVLPYVLPLAAPGAALVALVKPQFEADRGAISKDGVVRDPEVRQRALASVQQWLSEQPGWHVLGTIESPITGGSGNVEFLIGARHAGA
jgi:23S rRNA (cytidine1920-2'-O)/16S rRNA (cytidine1409-2'-O)-methyltransferase